MIEKGQSNAQVFISYSHKDKKWLDRLNVHLTPIKRSNSILIWDDTSIQAGMKWDDEIKKALSSIQVAVLLISADFLASEYIYNNELPVILDAAAKKGATILSLIVSPCMISSVPELVKIQAVNDPKNPLINMSDVKRESLFLKVAEKILELLKHQTEKINIGLESTKNVVDRSSSYSSVDQIKNQIQLLINISKDDRFLIVSVGDLYVQYGYSPDTAEMQFEAASNQFLPEEHKLSENQIAAIISLGFNEPNQDSPNYCMFYTIKDKTDVQKIAELTSDIFFKIHKLPLNSNFSFEQGDF